jgi:hypothetical protein
VEIGLMQDAGQFSETTATNQFLYSSIIQKQYQHHSLVLAANIATRKTKHCFLLISLPETTVILNIVFLLAIGINLFLLACCTSKLFK